MLESFNMLFNVHIHRNRVLNGCD